MNNKKYVLIVNAFSRVFTGYLLKWRHAITRTNLWALMFFNIFFPSEIGSAITRRGTCFLEIYKKELK